LSTVASVDHLTAKGVRPAIDDLLATARGLKPLLKERAKDTEANRRVSAETTQLLADAGLFRLVKPKRFGGFEYGPSAMLRLGFELGQACGSTAWCAMLANLNSLLASYWPLEAQIDIWDSNPDNLLAGTVVPTGRCERAEGGYLISGRWPWASNCENSQWLFVSATLPGSDSAPPGPGWFLTPRESLNIDQNSWYVSGMQGTGSKVVFTDSPVFIPEYRMIRFSDVLAGTTPGRSIPGNVQAGFGFSTFGAVALVAPLLGMAQGALTWFAQAMQSKLHVGSRPGAPIVAAHNPFTQERAGKASVAIDAALTLLLTDLGGVESKIQAGAIIEVAERIRIRRDCGFAARQAQDAVNALFEGAGGSGADLEAPIQQYWRDINAAARHVSLDVQAINSVVGQHLFALQPVGMY
jgi:resorcinol 4-hydroxylase (FADH2)